jgi:hypothetical protein
MAHHSLRYLSARPCKYGLNGTKQLYALGGQDVTTHARSGLRPRLVSVYHVRDLATGMLHVTAKDTGGYMAAASRC